MDENIYLLAYSEIPWYRRWFPWLPAAYRVKSLRLFVFLLTPCRYYSQPVTKKHRLDVLRTSRWGIPIGLNIWY